MLTIHVQVPIFVALMWNKVRVRVRVMVWVRVRLKVHLTSLDVLHAFDWTLVREWLARSLYLLKIHNPTVTRGRLHLSRKLGADRRVASAPFVDSYMSYL